MPQNSTCKDELFSQLAEADELMRKFAGGGWKPHLEAVNFFARAENAIRECSLEELWGAYCRYAPRIPASVTGSMVQRIRALAGTPRVLSFLWSPATREAIMGLTPREERVLILRFGLEGDQPQSLGEVGAAIGRSKERVRQIENKALAKLFYRVPLHL